MDINNLAPMIGGIVGSLAVVGYVARSIGKRMNGIDRSMEHKISRSFCEERSGNIQRDLGEIKADLNAIKRFLFERK